MTLTVSALGERVGVSADTVRYYERVGVLPPTGRSPVGYRLYDEAAIDRLRFIKGAQRVGLRLREIGELLETADRGQCPCGHTEALLQVRLAEVDAELARLSALRGEMARLLDEHLVAACSDGSSGEWWCGPEFQRRADERR